MNSKNEPAGVWLRVSTKDQSEANQEPEVLRLCREREYNVKRRYELNDFSAYKGEQEEQQRQVIADIRDGKIKVLVCWHSDRLERRGGLALLNFIAAIRDAGGRVESQQQPELGKANFSGRIVTFIAGEMDHEKSAHIGEQVKLSIQRSKANGAIYNNVPWGFDVTGDKYNKRIVPADVCRLYAPQIFQRCIDGDSLRTIAAWLDSEGVKPKRGSKWNESAVRWIIKNRVYAGTYLNREGKTITTCEAVIKPSVFDRANAALKSRPKRGPTNPNAPVLAKLRCARCGASMYRIKSGSTRKRYYYRCFGNGPQRKGCGNMVPFEETEYIVAARVGMTSTEPHRTKTWIEGTNWDDEISNVMLGIRELPQRLDPLSDEYDETMVELKAKLRDYRSRETEPGRWQYTDVLNRDGSVQTVGQYFYGLDAAGRREYLKTRDIRVERVGIDVGELGEIPALRIVLDGVDIGVTPITHEFSDTLQKR